jgi:hypothetical protein
MKTRFIQGLGASMLAWALVASTPGEAGAQERWQHDQQSGDWVLVETPGEEAALAPRRRRQPDAPAAKEVGPMRSGLAIAGGVVLSAAGAYCVAIGGLGLFWEAASQTDDPMAYAPAAGVTVLGLAAAGGGVALMVWGGRRDAPEVAIAVAPGRVGLGGSF